MVFKKGNKPLRPYEPPLRVIRKACERIQAGWSERTHRKRAGFISKEALDGEYNFPEISKKDWD